VPSVLWDSGMCAGLHMYLAGGTIAGPQVVSSGGPWFLLQCSGWRNPQQQQHITKHSGMAVLLCAVLRRLEALASHSKVCIAELPHKPVDTS
jgi:hypothetical protein